MIIVIPRSDNPIGRSRQSRPTGPADDPAAEGTVATASLQGELARLRQMEETLRRKEIFLRAMGDASPLAFYVVDNRTDSILYFNHRFCEIWGIEQMEERMRRGELKNNDIIHACLHLVEDVAAFAESCKPLQSEECRATVEDEIAFLGDRTVRRFSTQVRDEQDRHFGRYYIFEDITQRKRAAKEIERLNAELESRVVQRTAQLRATNEALQDEVCERRRAEETLERRMELERTPSGISARFVGVIDIDGSINASLADTGALSEASRAYLFLFRDDGTVMDNTHEWCAEGVSPQIGNLQNLPSAMFPWWMSKLGDGEVIHVTDVSKMPPEARAEREILESQDIRSLLVLPVNARGELAGFMGFDNVRGTGEWRDQDLAILRICSEIVGNALERQQADQAVRESEVRFRAMFERAAIGIALVGMDERLVDANPALERMLGYSREDLRNMAFADFTHPDYAPANLELFSALLAGRRDHYQVESRYVRKDGRSVWARLTASLIQGPGGEPRLNLCMVEDVTERRRMQEQLLRAQRLEMAGQIAAQVAHDFNNLLVPMAAYPELIKMRLPGNHPAVPFCDIMLQAARQMAEINGDMMALGRRDQVDKEPIDLNRVVEQALERMPEPPATLTIDLDLAVDLLPVRGSPAQSSRVISNLVSNAREAMEDLGLLHVKTENVYVDQPFGRHNQVGVGEYVKLSVTDTGCGILPEILDRIFDPFFTTKSKLKMPGSGLGLSIVQAVVEDHRGHIDLETAVGRGTTFSVYLPAHRDTLKEVANGELRGGTETVLVVDDDQLQRDAAMQMLRALGYRVDVVASGEEAVAYLRDRLVDLLLLDMVMPRGMDGAETYRRALEVRPGQRAIVVSGYAESERVQAAQALGAGIYLRKPVTLGRLARAVRQELDRDESHENPPKRLY